jgi:RNA polymerase sigma factor (sigma-70 family)
LGDGALVAPKGLSVTEPLLSALPDVRLATLAARGSEGAFAVLYRRHHQAIFRYARAIVGNEHDAGDVLQETMVKAMRALQGETRELAVRPWLYRIAHNEAIDLLRRRRQSGAVEALEDVMTTEDDVEMRERLRRLMDDLRRLTVRQRSALVMRELSGLSYPDIAGALETTPADAKQAVYEARLALNELQRAGELSCTEVRARISEHDRRRLRGRTVRAHLDTCESCRGFAAGIGARRKEFAAVAPLPAPAAVAILEGIIGGGGSGGAAIAAGGTAIGGAMAKLGVAGVAVLSAGAIAFETTAGGGPSAGSGDAGTEPAPLSSSEDAEAASALSSTVAGGGESSARDGRSTGGSGDAGRGRAANGSPAQTDARGGSANELAAAASPAAGEQANATSPGAHVEGPSAATDAAPANEQATAETRDAGPASTPPGHGGIPPGQGGTPPGLGSPPPGHGEAPPGGTAPPPGQTVTPPGQTITPPGHGGTPPGHGGAPPGQGPR